MMESIREFGENFAKTHGRFPLWEELQGGFGKLPPNIG